jgi:hypothetical protein
VFQVADNAAARAHAGSGDAAAAVRLKPDQVAGAGDAGFSAEMVDGSWVYNASKLRNIFWAKGSLISVCLGTVSTTPVLGLIHNEWDDPSRLR